MPSRLHCPARDAPAPRCPPGVNEWTVLLEISRFSDGAEERSSGSQSRGCKKGLRGRLRVRLRVRLRGALHLFLGLLGWVMAWSVGFILAHGLGDAGFTWATFFSRWFCLWPPKIEGRFSFDRRPTLEENGNACVTIPFLGDFCSWLVSRYFFV